jgi:small neutral amino acid transporter SnatA (MarC family)
VEHSFASATILLLLITDPLGNIPLFANALKAAPQARRARGLDCFCRAAGLYVCGARLFVGAGLVRGVAAHWRSAGAVFDCAAHDFPPSETAAAEYTGEPLIVPLVIPALAGPSALATVRLLEWKGALCVTMGVCALVLLSAERLQRLVGLRVVSAFKSSWA